MSSSQHHKGRKQIPRLASQIARLNATRWCSQRHAEPATIVFPASMLTRTEYSRLFPVSTRYSPGRPKIGFTTNCQWGCASGLVSKSLVIGIVQHCAKPLQPPLLTIWGHTHAHTTYTSTHKTWDWTKEQAIVSNVNGKHKHNFPPPHLFPGWTGTYRVCAFFFLPTQKADKAEHLKSRAWYLPSQTFGHHRQTHKSQSAMR